MAKEFICGNHDGRDGANNATYNVCRIEVSEGDLKKELAAGLHPRLDALEMQWLSCPAMGAKSDASNVKPLSDFVQAGLGPDPGHRLELIRKMAGNGGYIVCRLGVPRTRMVEEVEAKLHPGYHVVSVRGDKFVRANPDKTKQNNVDKVGRPWSGSVVCPISRLTAC